jgi:hypothetical protein
MKTTRPPEESPDRHLIPSVAAPPAEQLAADLHELAIAAHVGIPRGHYTGHRLADRLEDDDWLHWATRRAPGYWPEPFERALQAVAAQRGKGGQ